MKSIFLGIVLALGLLSFSSCEDDNLFWGAFNKEEVQEVDSALLLPHPELTGTVYLMGRKTDNSLCQPDTSCECCLERLIFVNDSEFVSIGYCQKNESYVRGKYRYFGSRIILNFNGFRKEKLHLGMLEKKNRDSLVTSERLVSTNHWELNYFECEGKQALKDEENYLVGTRQEDSAEKWMANINEMGI